MSALPRRSVVPPAVEAGGFPAEIEAYALRLRSEGTATAGFLADELIRVAGVARFLGAGSPLEFAQRREVEEDNLRTHWYDLGRRHAEADAHELRVFGPLGRPLDPTGRDPLH